MFEGETESSLNLVCPLEMLGAVTTEEVSSQSAPRNVPVESSRTRREAGNTAEKKIRQIAADDEK